MKETEETFGVPKSKQIEPEVQLVVFKLGTEEYGVRIEHVKEVTVATEISRIPRTSPYIKGISSIRGEIIAIMDLEARFGLISQSTDQDSKNYILVVENDDQSIGIIVSEVPQSVSIPVSQIDRTPNVIQEIDIAEVFVEGIGKLPSGRLIIILDILNILSSKEIEKNGIMNIKNDKE